MTKKDMGVIAVKLLAVYMFISAAAAVPQVILMRAMPVDEMLQGTWMALWTSHLAAMFLYMGMAVLLWLLADWLASRMLPGADGSVVWPSVSRGSLLAVGLVTIGIVSVAEGLPDLVHTFLKYWPNGWIASTSHNEIIVALSKIIVGAALMALPLVIATLRKRQESNDESESS